MFLRSELLLTPPALQKAASVRFVDPAFVTVTARKRCIDLDAAERV
jgi:hypothetical protein